MATMATPARFFSSIRSNTRMRDGIEGPATRRSVHLTPTRDGCSLMTRLYSGVMADHSRYAIYHAPAAGSDLDRFGAQLLGYDAFSGENLPFPNEIIRMAPDWRDLTEDPRKYGFHATLKAPMSLAPGRTEPELLAACESFAGKPRPIPVLKPVVGSISGFIAVVPAEPSPDLERLAADCTTRIRFISRAAHTGGSCAAKSFGSDAEAARIPRPLGISVCHGRVPLPHDADRPACR